MRQSLAVDDVEARRLRSAGKKAERNEEREAILGVREHRLGLALALVLHRDLMRRPVEPGTRGVAPRALVEEFARPDRARREAAAAHAPRAAQQRIETAAFPGLGELILLARAL